MLELKNCVIASPGVEIHIPAGTYLLCPDEIPIENGISVYSHDETYRMVWQVNEDCEGSTDEGLLTLLEDMSPGDIVQPIMPLTVNGLSGHCVAYNVRKSGNYEARFALSNGQQVYFYIITETGLKIETLMETQEFREALNTVRRA